jgi:hypothetical protein
MLPWPVPSAEQSQLARGQPACPSRASLPEVSQLPTRKAANSAATTICNVRNPPGMRCSRTRTKRDAPERAGAEVRAVGTASSPKLKLGNPPLNQWPLFRPVMRENAFELVGG